MRIHLTHRATSALRAGGAEADAMYDELVELSQDSHNEHQMSDRPSFTRRRMVSTASNS